MLKNYKNFLKYLSLTIFSFGVTLADIAIEIIEGPFKHYIPIYKYNIESPPYEECMDLNNKFKISNSLDEKYQMICILFEKYIVFLTIGLFIFLNWLQSLFKINMLENKETYFNLIISRYGYTIISTKHNR